MSRVRSARPAAARCPSRWRPSRRCEQRQTGEGMAANAETPVPGEPAELGRQGSADGDVPREAAGDDTGRPAPTRHAGRCRTGWCGRPPRCCWPIPTSSSPSGSAPSTSCALPSPGAAAQTAGTHRVEALRRTRPDARRGRVRRDLRPATAIHDVPDVLDRRRHPQPRPGDARLRRRPTATPASRPPVDEAPDHLPVVLEFAATVDPVAGRRLLVEHRVPIDVLREALTECRIAVRRRHFRGVRDAAAGHRPGSATGAAAGAGRPARGSGWPATVHADGAAPTYRRRPVT